MLRPSEDYPRSCAQELPPPDPPADERRCASNACTLALWTAHGKVMILWSPKFMWPVTSTCRAWPTGLPIVGLGALRQRPQLKQWGAHTVLKLCCGKQTARALIHRTVLFPPKLQLHTWLQSSVRSMFSCMRRQCCTEDAPNSFQDRPVWLNTMMF